MSSSWWTTLRPGNRGLPSSTSVHLQRCSDAVDMQHDVSARGGEVWRHGPCCPRHRLKSPPTLLPSSPPYSKHPRTCKDAADGPRVDRWAVLGKEAAAKLWRPVGCKCGHAAQGVSVLALMEDTGAAAQAHTHVQTQATRTAPVPARGHVVGPEHGGGHVVERGAREAKVADLHALKGGAALKGGWRREGVSASRVQQCCSRCVRAQAAAPRASTTNCTLSLQSLLARMFLGLRSLWNTLAAGRDTR
jgi:hypothetical protein